MRVVISADIEGATGYAGGTEGGFPASYAGPGETHPDYIRQRHLLTADINAEIEGAVEAGATEFLDREVAYTCSWMPDVQYDGNRTVSYTEDSFLALHEFLLAAFWIGASKLNP